MKLDVNYVLCCYNIFPAISQKKRKRKKETKKERKKVEAKERKNLEGSNKEIINKLHHFQLCYRWPLVDVSWKKEGKEVYERMWFRELWVLVGFTFVTLFIKFSLLPVWTLFYIDLEPFFQSQWHCQSHCCPQNRFPSIAKQRLLSDCVNVKTDLNHSLFAHDKK